MKVIRLTNDHKEQIKHLFNNPKFMGVDHENNYFVDRDFEFTELYLSMFAGAYLSDNKNYIAYGILNDDNTINSLLAFYESIDDPSWYWTHVRTTGNNGSEIKMLLDEAMRYNESQGRFKFYSMFPLKYQNVYRRLAFSSEARERYDYFDEFFVKEKHQPKFTLIWQILYNRTLVPTESIVRCTFLKQKYRSGLYHAGRL